MQQEPPAITITNPSEPAYGGDVLERGSEREPWRPTAPSRRTALMLCAPLLLGGVGVGDVAYQRSQLAADRREVARIALSADSHRPLPSASVTLDVVNEGPHTVSLLTARLVGAGYVEEKVGLRIAPGHTVTVHLADSARCSPTLMSSPTSTVVVSLQTQRGQHVERRLSLSPFAVVAVNEPVSQRCGYVPTGEALRLALVGSRRLGSDVVLTVAATNNTLLPLRIIELKAVPGIRLTASPALPLQVPAQVKTNDASRRIRFTLTLRVTSCRLASEASSVLLYGWAQRGSTVTELPVELTTFAGGSPVLDLLLKTCP